MNSLYIDARDMTDAEAKEYSATYCSRRSVRFWGTESKVKPVLIRAVFGDGKRPMWLEPMMSRPNYYVFSGHSGWSMENSGENAFCAYLEQVYQWVEEQVGNSDDKRERGESKRDWERRTNWPALDTSGMSWGSFRSIAKDSYFAPAEAGLALPVIKEVE